MSLVENKLPPQLNEDMVEAVTYLPDEVIDWFRKGDEIVDDLSLQKYGFRISPKAIRSLLLALNYGFYVDRGDDVVKFELPNREQVRSSSISYALFNDFINIEEAESLITGENREW